MTHSIEEMAQACEHQAIIYASYSIAEVDADVIAIYEKKQAVLESAAKALRRHKAVFAMIYDLAMANEWPDKSDGERIVQIAGIASMQDDEVVAAMEGSAATVAGAGER